MHFHLAYFLYVCSYCTLFNLDKKWCLEEINMLLVWSVCGTIYKLNTEKLMKAFFITYGNMQLTGGEKQWLGCSFVISSTPIFMGNLTVLYQLTHSFINPWHFQKHLNRPQSFSIDKSFLLFRFFKRFYIVCYMHQSRNIQLELSWRMMS